MSEHTPGPYLREDRTVYALEQCGWVKGEPRFRNRMSAGVQGTAPQDELEAVAQLFAAAPDMYEGLKDARDAINTLPQDALGTAYAVIGGEQMPFPIRDQLIDKITKALAKAEAK